MTPNNTDIDVDTNPDHLVFEVVVFHHYANFSAAHCSEEYDDFCCDCSNEEMDQPEPDDHAVTYGLFLTSNGELAVAAAARKAGNRSASEWLRQLNEESDVPKTLTAVERPVHHLTEDERSRIIVLRDTQ